MSEKGGRVAGNGHHEDEGAGETLARRMARNRRAIVESVTAQDMAEIMEALWRRAMGGDVEAAELVLRYTLGPPRRG
jgi:hypothetical protein